MAGDICCDTIIGGRVFVVVGDRTYEVNGEVTISPVPISRDGGVSSGGRLWGTEAAQPQTATVTFLNFCDADPLEIFNARCHVDVTVVEKDRGFRHLFTRSLVTGTIEQNLSNGEFGGIVIMTDKYSRVTH